MGIFGKLQIVSSECIQQYKRRMSEPQMYEKFFIVKFDFFADSLHDTKDIEKEVLDNINLNYAGLKPL
jgi:hypothetical protein